MGTEVAIKWIMWKMCITDFARDYFCRKNADKDDEMGILKKSKEK